MRTNPAAEKLYLRLEINVLSVFFSKYRSVVLAIALFLLLDASVLSLNFYISYQIADDAVAVNNAGRQRMLSQRMVKSAYDIRSAGDNPAASERAARELRSTSKLFDQTLQAFDQGGTITGADQSKVLIKPVTQMKTRNTLNRAQHLWTPLKAAIDDLLAVMDASQNYDAQLNQVLSLAQMSNLQLLNLMNQLTGDLEAAATAKATRLRWIQTVGISLAVINFFIILFHFIGTLRDNDTELEASRKETADILDTVNEGLFLLDHNLLICAQHSAQLKRLLGGKPLARRNIIDVLREFVSDKDLEVAQRFINLLFRRDVRAQMIRDLNPLDKLEIHIPERSGGFATRYLQFDFQRVVEQGHVSHILVTVNDVTDRVLLARELDYAKQSNKHQLAMLASVLHAEPFALKRFIDNGFDSCENINDILRQQARGSGALLTKLNEARVEIQRFKGEAQAYQFEQFAQWANEFETTIEALKNKADLQGNDLLPLAVQLESLLKQLEAVQALAEKLDSFSEQDYRQRAPQGISAYREKWAHLFDFTRTTAEREKKQAYLVMSGFNEAVLERELNMLVHDLCVQFIRSAIVHGLELPNVRKSQNKPPVGRIDLRLAELPEGQLELTVSDDGRGMDYDLIRRKALATGRWSSKELASWSHKKLLMLIFEPGFSNSSRSKLDTEDKVGMDVIANRIKQVQGTIRVNSRPGKQCLFTLTFPKRKLMAAANAA